MTNGGIRIDRVFVVVNVGTVLDPAHLEAQLPEGPLGPRSRGEPRAQGATTTALGRGTTTRTRGPAPTRARSSRSRHMSSGTTFTVSVSPAASADTIFAATGKRIGGLPLNKQHIDLV